MMEEDDDMMYATRENTLMFNMAEFFLWMNLKVSEYVENFAKTVQRLIIILSICSFVLELVLMMSCIISIVDIIIGSYVMAPINMVYVAITMVLTLIFGIVGATIYTKSSSDRTQKQQFRSCVFVYVTLVNIWIGAIFFFVNLLLVGFGYHHLKPDSNFTFTFSAFTGLLGLYLLLICCGLSCIVGFFNYQNERYRHYRSKRKMWVTFLLSPRIIVGYDEITLLYNFCRGRSGARRMRRFSRDDIGIDDDDDRVVRFNDKSDGDSDSELEPVDTPYDVYETSDASQLDTKDEEKERRKRRKQIRENRKKRKEQKRRRQQKKNKKKESQKKSREKKKEDVGDDDINTDDIDTDDLADMTEDESDRGNLSAEVEEMYTDND